MSEENVEIVRRMFDAYLTGDTKAAFAAFDPGVEWDISAHPLPDWPNTGSGGDALQRQMTSYILGFREYRFELRGLIDAGEEIVVALHETVALRDSESVLDRDLIQVWTIRNGVIVRLRVFKTKAEALEAAELSE